MIDRLGHALVAWFVPINVGTAVLLACAMFLDRLLARRTHASMRIALYAPIALRVLLPLSWSISVARVSKLALAMPLQVLSPSAGGASGAPSVFPWYAAVGGAYLAVVLVLGLRAIGGRLKLARAIASALPLRSIDAPCPVLSHGELGPMVVGLVVPRIVLPQALIDRASAPALACITKHEVAHVRRGDPWLVAAIDLLVVVAWPVLPLWFAAGRVRHLIELACDEAALENADSSERRRYGHLLVDFAEQEPFGASTAALHFASTLRARIEAIAFQRPWPRALQVTLVSVAVAAFAACSSAAPSGAPQSSGGSGASSAGPDQYGYQFEHDPLRTSAATNAVPDRAPHGRLAPELIQNVVRQNFGRFRKCYEDAQAHNAKLEGTVTVSYVIAPDGSTHEAADKGSTLPDLQAIQCVVQGFGVLTYPPPDNGYVTVVYPIEFRPGD